MKITKQIKKIGDSYFILIPNHIMKNMFLKEKDIIEVEILELIERPDDTHKYRCLRSCGEPFYTSEIPYCPICGSEDVEELKLKKSERR